MLTKNSIDLITRLSHNVSQQRLRVLLRPSCPLRFSRSKIPSLNRSVLYRLQNNAAGSQFHREHLPRPKSRFLKFINITLRTTVGIAFFFALGATASIWPFMSSINAIIEPMSDAETLDAYIPIDDESAEINNYIQNHPLTLSLRADPALFESRPHMKIPEAMRVVNLTGGTLAGPGRIVVPPFSFAEAGGKSLINIFYLGDQLCGHPGIVHGGLLATLLDEGLARCCFPALPGQVGMTANLNVNYRKPTLASKYFVLRAKTIKIEGRKAWVEGWIETLVEEGEEPLVLVEASALFVSPKAANSLPKVHSPDPPR